MRRVRLGRGAIPSEPPSFVRGCGVAHETTFPLLTRLDQEQTDAFREWMEAEGLTDPGDAARRLIHDEMVRMGLIENRPHAR